LGWLLETVGHDGKVVAVDIKIHFIGGMKSPYAEARKGDLN
jgi:hypothetical protein